MDGNAISINKIRIIILIVLFIFFGMEARAGYILNISIKDSVSHEALVGATVRDKTSGKGGFTDAGGNVKLNLPKETAEISVSYLGYKTCVVKFAITSADSVLNVLLVPESVKYEEVTVSAVRTNSTIENVPTKIEIVGFDDLNEENGVKPGNILSILGDMAGIQLQQVSASSGNTFARIQGLNGRYTQILRDGLPLFGGMSGNFSLMQIPPLDLRQIEVIRGCGSTLFGGDAIAGIINLVSREPSKHTELSLSANQTTVNETNMNFWASDSYHKLGYTLFAGYTYQKHKDVDGDGLTDVPDVGSFLIHPKLIVNISPFSKLELGYSGAFDNRTGGQTAYFGNNAVDSFYHVNEKVSRNSADLRWNYIFGDKSNLMAKIGISNVKSNIGTKHFDFVADETLWFSEISYLKSYSNTDWVLGANFNGDNFDFSFDRNTGLKPYNYSTLGFFLQNTWHTTEKLSFESGFRGDYNSSGRFFALPRISAMYKIDKDFTLRFNCGLGYKIPSVVSYIDPETDISKLSTYGLDPELSQGINADINYHTVLFDKLDIVFNQSVFYTNIGNPVYDSSSSISLVGLQNADKSLRTYGFHSYLRAGWEDFELYVGYFNMTVEQLYDPSHITPRATPAQTLSSTCFYEFSDNLRFGLEYSYIANQLDDNYKPVPNYNIVAAMLQVKFSKFTIVLNGENLLDVRQTKYGKIYEGSLTDPVFHKLWSPIEGRVINLSVRWNILGKN